MMRGLVALSVVVMLASSAMGVTWWGGNDYTGKAFINFGDRLAGAAITGGVSERFTARSNATARKIRLTLDSTNSLVGPPTATLGIYADNGAGSPGAMLGISPAFVLPAAAPLEFEATMGANVNLVAGNVYHVTMLYAGVEGSGDNSRVRIGMQKASLDQRTLNGRLEIDNNLAGLFYLKGDVMYPDGWYEGKRAEFTKVWEPMFGLYNEQSVGLDEGEGCDTRFYDRSGYGNPYDGMSFLVQGVPAADQSDPNTTRAQKIRINLRKKNDPGDLLVRLLDAADNQLASATKTAAQISNGWNEFAIPLTDLTIGSRYQIVMENVGTSSYGDHYEPYYEVFGAVVPDVASWQGLQAYDVESLDGGLTYVATTQLWEWEMQLELIPEPATLGLLVIGGLAVLARKRR